MRLWFENFDLFGCICLDNSWGVRENTIIVIKVFCCQKPFYFVHYNEIGNLRIRFLDIRPAVVHSKAKSFIFYQITRYLFYLIICLLFICPILFRAPRRLKKIFICLLRRMVFLKRNNLTKYICCNY